MSNILTTSRMRSWRECRRLHHLTYIRGWRTKRPPDSMRFGALVHQGLESWWKDDGTGRLVAALDAIHGHGADPYDQVAAEELLAGYDRQWGDEDRYEVLAVEVTFQAPLLNPVTGAVSKTWVLAGKIDVLVRDRVIDCTLIVEHKTTQENIGDPADPYWAKLGMDGQVSQYYIGADSLEHRAEGCLYDVLLRPRLKPLKATPEDLRRYTKAGTLYANQRDSDETPEEYRARIQASIAEGPEKYFQRRMIARTERDIIEYLGDVWAEGRMMREAELADRAPRNSESCHRFGTCQFWDTCAYGVNPADHPELFELVTNVHPELDLQEAI